MTLNSDFSVFALVDRLQDKNTLLRHRRTMSLASYEIENITLEDQAYTRIFSGFQLYSKFVPQIERYRHIAARSQAVYVFGVPDVELPAIPNITYVPIAATDKLAQEWFLISYGTNYASALAIHEITQIQEQDALRIFKGVWTFDYVTVRFLHDALTRYVGQDPITIPQTRHYSQEVSLMSKSLQRMASALVRMSNGRTRRPNDEVMKTEVAAMIEQELDPALQQLKASRPNDVHKRSLLTSTPTLTISK